MSKHKKKKIQKMKDKYAEQDDEEREMRLKLLGAKKVEGVDLKKLDAFKEQTKEEDKMDVEEDDMVEV